MSGPAHSATDRTAGHTRRDQFRRHVVNTILTYLPRRAAILQHRHFRRSCHASLEARDYGYDPVCPDLSRFAPVAPGESRPTSSLRRQCERGLRTGLSRSPVRLAALVLPPRPSTRRRRPGGGSPRPHHHPAMRASACLGLSRLQIGRDGTFTRPCSVF